MSNKNISRENGTPEQKPAVPVEKVIEELRSEIMDELTADERRQHVAFYTGGINALNMLENRLKGRQDG